MENLKSYGFQELTEERMSQFKLQVYHPYLTALAQHLYSLFPDMGPIKAFSIFDPSAMEKQSASRLLENLETLTAHYVVLMM